MLIMVCYFKTMCGINQAEDRVTWPDLLHRRTSALASFQEWLVVSAWLRIRAQPRNPCQPRNSASASTWQTLPCLMVPLVCNQPFWGRKFRGITMVMVVTRAWGLLKVELFFLKCYFMGSFKRLFSPGFLEKCNITSICTCEMKFPVSSHTSKGPFRLVSFESWFLKYGLRYRSEKTY